MTWPSGAIWPTSSGWTGTAPASQERPAPRLEGDGEVVFSNGTRGVVKFEPVAVRQTQPVIPVGSVVVPFRAA